MLWSFQLTYISQKSNFKFQKKAEEKLCTRTRLNVLFFYKNICLTPKNLKNWKKVANFKIMPKLLKNNYLRFLRYYKFWRFKCILAHRFFFSHFWNFEVWFLTFISNSLKLKCKCSHLNIAPRTFYQGVLWSMDNKMYCFMSIYTLFAFWRTLTYNI